MELTEREWVNNYKEEKGKTEKSNNWNIFTFSCSVDVHEFSSTKHNYLG